MRYVEYIRPPYSIIFVADGTGGKAPEPVWGAKILSTPSGVSVAVRPEVDGRTRLTFGLAADVMVDSHPDFDDFLDIPTKTLAVSDAYGRHFVQAHLDADIVRVRIWRSHPDWPKRVTVGWDTVTVATDENTLPNFPTVNFLRP